MTGADDLTPSEAVAQAEARIKSLREADFISDHGRLLRPETHTTFDPFRRGTTPPAPHPWLRLLLAIFLVPLRIGIALTGALIAYMIVLAVGPGVTRESQHTYATARLPSWRRSACEAATRLLARALLLALGFWRVRGAGALGHDPRTARGATIVSNHVGVADPCLLAYLFAPSFVAKMAVSNIPLVGRVGAAQHALYINRLDGGARRTAAAIAARQRLAADMNAQVPPVCIFPEGTTTNGKHLLRFRTGAFVAGMPVAPVLLKYPHRYFSPSFEAIKPGPYLWGLISQPWNSVYYYRLPVYEPSAEEREDARLYADNVRKLMHEYSDFLDGKKFILSDANFIDKKEYLAVLRGERLQAGLKLT